MHILSNINQHKVASKKRGSAKVKPKNVPSSIVKLHVIVVHTSSQLNTAKLWGIDGVIEIFNFSSVCSILVVFNEQRGFSVAGVV